MQDAFTTANETRIDSLDSYFRWNEELRRYEINERINPNITSDRWQECPSQVRDMMCNPDHRPTLGQIIWVLNTFRMEANKARREYDEHKTRAADAIRHIGESLIVEAENRGWCDEYDSFVEALNDSLPPDLMLPVRLKEYEVEIQIDISHTVYQTVSVMATSQDEANRMIENDADSHVDINMIIEDDLAMSCGYDSVEVSLQ
jgi:hypothetical protein